MMRRAMMSGFASGTSLPLRRVRMAGTGQPPPPGINCQATQDGGAICSEGTGFSPTCPKKPNPNVPGVAEYRQEGNLLIPIPPPPPGPGQATTASSAQPGQQASQFAASACPMAAINAGVAGGAITAPISTGPVPMAPTPAAAPAAAPAPVAAAAPPPPPISAALLFPVSTSTNVPEDKANPLVGLAALGGLSLLVYLLVK